MKVIYWLIGLVSWSTKEEKMKYFIIALLGAMLIAGVVLAVVNV